MRWKERQRMLIAGRDRNPFVPFWRPLPTRGYMNSDPISWIFFVVAGIGGRRQPLAAVSWTGVGEDGSVPGGWSVLSCCCRLLAAFRDPANRRALRAELALAHDFHLNEAAAAAGPGRKVAELRECNRSPSWDDRFNDWDTVSTARFPFIASCAFQAVASDPFDTNPRHAFVEPICTVYRDTSIEWGMAVIDITDLHDPAYGLVAFPVVPMKFTPDHAAAVRAVSADPHPWYETQGELRVMYEDRPRQPLSAVDYIARFDDEQERWSASYLRESVLNALSRVPLADAMSTELIWPPRPQDDASLAISSASAWKKQRDSISVLIQESLSKGSFNPSIFEEYKRETGFLETLRQSILLNSARLDLPDGLIEFSFLEGSHLSLEQFPRLSPDAISRLLQVPSMARVESISLCLDSIDGSPPRLVDALSQTTKLQRVYLMQKPRNPRVALSAEIFMAMAATPGFLSRVEVFMAGPHSSSLCKKQWLLESTIPAHLQLVLFETFPMQQMLVTGCKNFWAPGLPSISVFIVVRAEYDCWGCVHRS
ncbi:hypothetical protein IF1G_01440 [Cordyceps javanica]|uniref:Uncharacterized protein n=1 Tax=Cordyceps javanica TaxID=43265 RepID=A0A545WAX2_9HYPO|nr:hypothetical protein IF1G_01440 [Cordyceps javanica]TQW11098.1 hypothetical protein IF2G_02040 [Cordyceps javanica]